MKIKSIEIKNFRGVGSAKIDVENFTTLIGPNNIGKSTILHAMHLLLDNKKPKQEDWPGSKPSDSEMIIEARFGDLEDWEIKKPAISQILHDGDLRVKMRSTWPSVDDDIFYEYSVYCSKEIIGDFPKGITEAKKEE